MVPRGPDKRPRKGHPLNPRHPAPACDPLAKSPSPVRRAIALKRYCEGRTTKEIAAELGVHESAVWQWSKRPEFQVAVEQMRQAVVADARRVLREGALAAARRLIDVASGRVARPDHAEVKAATEVLDRVGVSATQVLDLTVHGDVRDMDDAALDKLIAERVADPTHDAPGREPLAD